MDPDVPEVIDLFAKCGCNCGRCPAYFRNAKTRRAKKRCSDGWKKYLGASLKPERCYCLGCQAREPWKTGNPLPDRGCYIRPCVVSNRLETCAQCSAYPCLPLRRRIPDEQFREHVERRLGGPIPEDDYLAFIEPYEGLKNLEMIRSCLTPANIVQVSEPKPLRAQVVAFPEKLSLPAGELAGLKSLHRLLVRIITAQAETVAEHEILRRRRNIILGLLWLFGSYGVAGGGRGRHLVIRSSDHESHREFGNIVRKRDGALHIAASQAFQSLENFGVSVEHKALEGRSWELRLRFERKAGGTRALRALKKHVGRLIKLHGKPTYAGASKYRGKAFERFTRAEIPLKRRRSAS